MTMKLRVLLRIRADEWNAWPGSKRFGIDEFPPFEERETHRNHIFALDDPRLSEIAERSAHPPPGECGLFSYWVSRPEWTTDQERAARAFHCDLRHFWHGGGCVYPTLYDHHLSCPLCRSGDRPASPLILPLGRLHKRQVVHVLGQEVIVTRALAKRMVAFGSRGLGFVPVLGGWREYRAMLASAGLGGLALSSRDATQDRLDEDAGLASTLRAHRDGLVRSEPYGDYGWFELAPAGVASVSTDTRAVSRLEDAWAGDDRCPCGLWLGRRLATPMGVASLDPVDADMWFTRERFGSRMGVYYPSRELIVSPRFANEFHDAFKPTFEFVPIL